MILLFVLIRGSKRFAQFLLLIGICDDVLKHSLQFFVSVHLRAQVGELLPCLNELAKRFNLLDDLIGFKIFDIVKLEVLADAKPRCEVTKC